MVVRPKNIDYITKLSLYNNHNLSTSSIEYKKAMKFSTRKQK